MTTKLGKSTSVVLKLYIFDYDELPEGSESDWELDYRINK